MINTRSNISNLYILYYQYDNIILYKYRSHTAQNRRANVVRPPGLDGENIPCQSYSIDPFDKHLSYIWLF